MFTIIRGKHSSRLPTLHLAKHQILLPRLRVGVFKDTWREDYKLYLLGLLSDRKPEFMELITLGFRQASQKGKDGRLVVTYQANREVELEFYKFLKEIYKPTCIALGIPLPPEKGEFDFDFG